MTRRPLPDIVAQRPQPVINPMALEMEPDGPRKRALEVSHSRVLLGASLFAVVFLVIAARLVAVTLLPDGAEAAMVPQPKVKTDRADIVDRNGVVLATSLTTASLYANPSQVQEPDETAQMLNSVLPDLNIASTAAKLDSRPRLRLAEAQPDAAPAAGGQPPRPARDLFPGGDQARLSARQPHRAPGRLRRRRQPRPGRGRALVRRSAAGRRRPLQLSIDVRVQHILHEELNRAIADFHGIGGAGIILDLKTGEVLSLVSLPDFDPARPGEASDDTRFDRATLGLYEMGSIFKIFNTAIALDSGTTTLADGFDATKPISIGGHMINDYNGKHRFLTIPEIFTYSSNIGSAKMADLFGAEIQQAYLKKLRPDGQVADRAAATSASRSIPRQKNWKRINTMTVSYGHGISVNAIQLLTAVGAVVNDGMLREPTLLKREPGEVPDGTRVISTQTSEQLRQLMRLVVQIGTGKKANAPGYLVGGKTGTADKQKGHGYATNSRLAILRRRLPDERPALRDPGHGRRTEAQRHQPRLCHRRLGDCAGDRRGGAAHRAALWPQADARRCAGSAESAGRHGRRLRFANRKKGAIHDQTSECAGPDSVRRRCRADAIECVGATRFPFRRRRLKLNDLILGIDDLRLQSGDAAIDVRDLALDSRRVKAGALFAALPGSKARRPQLRRGRGEGRRVASSSRREGSTFADLPAGVAVLTAKEPRRALARLAARFFGHQPQSIAAVTGTSGKTSTVAFARQLWIARRARGGQPRHARHHLAQAERSGLPHHARSDRAASHRWRSWRTTAVTHLAMEASSHGLDQHRLDGVKVTAAAFTNLSQDHLDYHADMASYFEAKLRLFSDLLPQGGTAVVNLKLAQAPRVIDIARQRRQRLITFGSAEADIQLAEAEADAAGPAAGARPVRRASRRGVPGGRRLPGGEPAGRARPRHRQRLGCQQDRRPDRQPDRRAGPHRACGGHAGRRRGLCRLRAQARRARSRADHAAPACGAAAGRRVRLRRRPRSRQAADDGRDRDPPRRPRHRHRRQSAQRRCRRRSAPRSWPRRRARSRSATAPRRSASA